MRRLFVCLLLLIVTTVVQAQDGDNLLRDPGFENTAMKVVVSNDGEGVSFAVNQDWNGWYTESPRTADWQNRIPNGTGRNNAGFGFVRSGNRSMELSRGFATFTAAIYQSVSAPAGSTVTGSAWYVMDLSDGASSQARVGIDPNGGSNPYDSDIVWSSWGGNQYASNGFRQLSVSTTATGDAVTIFLFATQTVPSESNGIFWDDASIVITGQAAAPTSQPQQPVNTAVPAATRAPIVTAAPGSDGAVVHVVQSGETLSSIAQAYGMTVDSVLALNPEITDARLIITGQRINIWLGEGVEPPATTIPATATSAVAQPPATLPSGTTNISIATFTPPPITQAAVDAQNLLGESGTVCVNMIEDANINANIEDDSSALAGGIITLRNFDTGEELGSYITTGERDHHCFQNVPIGMYTASAIAPDGYGLTTSPELRLRVFDDSSVNAIFGAALGVENAPIQIDDNQPDGLVEVSTEGSTNVLIQNIGWVIFGLAGLTLFTGMLAVFVLNRRD